MKIFLLLMVLPVAGTALAYEEPRYEVVEQRGDYEVRRYLPFIVAETEVEAEFDEAGSQAFRRLFAYISGDNTAVPVTDSRPSETIKMTVPVVTTTPAAPGKGRAAYAYYFVMPSHYTLETLPRPSDSRVRIRRVPEHTVAVRRYSGRSNETNYHDNRRLLLEHLERDGIRLAGEPVFAVYNSPFTPWFMRRNEVMVEIAQ